MKLADYFARPCEEFLKPTPAAGESTGWLDFCDLELKGAHMLIVDAQFVPSEKDGLLVALAPGKYSVQAMAVNYGGDRRIARLRAFQKGTNPKPGGEIGKTWTDTAKTGICDFEIFHQAWGDDDDASYKIIEPFFESDIPVGMAVFDASCGAVMPFVASGCGDGSFPVLELLENERRIGFEIEFIAGNKEYPFDETPYQKQCRLNELEQRATQGDVETQFQLARMYQTGDQVEQDLAKAIFWFEESSRNGSAEAARILGALYKSGNGLTQDYARAKELFELAVARGSISALNELGVLYRHGHGVAVNYEKAVEYFQLAAEKGIATAQYNLGVHCSKGWGIEPSYAAAVKWYQLAADQGNLNAIFNLGCIYKRGEVGAPKNEAEAVKLFGAGAMAGHAGCANNLGDSYETGAGVEKDLKKAFIWYALAAGKGVAIAQRNLGLLNRKGEGGVKQNLAAALKWLGKASENGDAEAQFELGSMYETGAGIAANKFEACKLYQKAMRNGLVKAGDRLKELMGTLTDAEGLAITENSKNEK